MARRVSVREVRANLADILGEVYYTKEPVIVEKKGRPMAVLINPEQYERYRENVMDRFERALDELNRRNAGRDPDQLLCEVDAVVEEIRQERFERRQQRPAAASDNG